MVAKQDQYANKENWIHAFILCVGFCVFIIVPLFLKDAWKGKESNSTEKPKLAVFSLRGIRNYQKDYERYFNEHFGFRNELVRLNSMINIRVFNASPSSRIILGKDLWLFYDDPEDGVSLRDFRGQARFNDVDLQRARKKVVDLKQRLEKKGVKLLIVVAPNKHTIYSEYLPLHDQRMRRGAVTRLDQLADVFKDFGADFIDLREALLLRKNSPYLLYYRTDTHWNAWGAFVAYEEIMKRVTSKGLRVHILRPSDFRIESHEGPCHGDIAQMVNMSGVLNDSEVVMQPLKVLTATKANIKYISTTAKGTSAREVKGTKLAKLLMFGDSFANALIPYLSESFSRSVYILTSDVDFSAVEDEKPDLVIFEIVERYLGNFVNDGK